ncbi:hypothetical protein Moror_13838 [Moniliophthora roreri MCA 2997]|uniref:Uncharacterized protein n=1 Tax=Moniliophthora roreri (strain MCA 2997) TaxID=1381753 RepID=V2XQI0_MONRO|nr:hypothetical protein Moror_13838 [Moniliophthora roreri MCA 2997]
MRYFRYFIALFLVVLCLTEVSLSAPAPPKKASAKKPAAPPAKKPATPARPPTPPPQRPATPPANSRPGSPAAAADPAEGGCAKQTTCSKCVAVKGSGGKAVCGFKKAGGGCVGLSTAPADTLAKNAAECKALDAESAATEAAEADFAKAAVSEFKKIKPHVFGTEKGLKNTSGRHLASALLKVPANKNLARTEDATTGLSRFATNGNKVKTTWDDDKGKYTQDEVQGMCEAAIKGVLKLKNTKTLPKGTAITSISVRSPRGMNLCISVQGNTSVFPGSTSATTTPAGQQCTPDAGVSDE